MDPVCSTGDELCMLQTKAKVSKSARKVEDEDVFDDFLGGEDVHDHADAAEALADAHDHGHGHGHMHGHGHDHGDVAQAFAEHEAAVAAAQQAAMTGFPSQAPLTPAQQEHDVISTKLNFLQNQIIHNYHVSFFSCVRRR